MRRENLIKLLLETGDKKTHRSLFEANRKLLNLKFAEALKNTYYTSWTNEPHKTLNAANALKVLTEFLSQNEVKAFHFWVAGIADLTSGKFEKSDKNLEKASEIFLSNDDDYNAAQTQVARLIAVSLVGKYELAFQIGERASKIFKKFKDILALGKIEKNLGNIAARQGDERRAEKYYLSARKRFIAIENLPELIMAENSLANTYAELNEFSRAEKFYVSALENARKSKMFVTEAEIEASMGNLALFRGNFADALRFLELSRQKYEVLKMPHQTAIANLEIADIYLELNLTNEAFDIYEKICDELKQLKMRSEEARARANFGRAAYVSGRVKIAKTQLKKAAQIYLAEKNPVGAAVVKISEAYLEKEQNNLASAAKKALEAKDLLRKHEIVRHVLTAENIEAEICRLAGKFKESEKKLTEIFRKSIRFKQPQKTLSALNSLGKLCLDKGDNRAAEKCFKRALKIVETLRAPLAGEEFRMSFLADKLAPYENLAKIFLSENKLKSAFEMIEKSRSRSLVESVNSNAEKTKSNKDSANLTEKLNRLREELNSYYSRLNRAAPEEIKDFREKTETCEKQISEVQRQISGLRKHTENSQINFDLKKFQTDLGERKALIEYVKFDGKFSAFVVTEKRIFYFENLAAENEIVSMLEGLHFQFGALRYGTGHLQNFLPELKKRADFYLAKLCEKIFAPLEKTVENLDLIIVPTGSLNYVPFNALLTENSSYLIEKAEVTIAPSATVRQYSANQKEKKHRHKNALLFGFADEKIPLVNKEINALKKLFHEAKSFVGANATFSAFTENADKFDVLHLACHGQFRADNPMFSSLHLADGWITVRDICSQKLRAELVTLSACETGLNKIFAGEEILGLSRGFLSAGAKSLVLSLWTVNDEATGELMQEFYSNLQRGESVSASLKAAQKKFIENRSHPYFWSPFFVVGK